MEAFRIGKEFTGFEVPLRCYLSSFAISEVGRSTVACRTILFFLSTSRSNQSLNDIMIGRSQGIKLVDLVLVELG